MAKTCIKCGKKIGLFSGVKCDDNNIRCDSCFEQYLKYKEKQIIKQIKKSTKEYENKINETPDTILGGYQVKKTPDGFCEYTIYCSNCDEWLNYKLKETNIKNTTIECSNCGKILELPEIKESFQSMDKKVDEMINVMENDKHSSLTQCPNCGSSKTKLFPENVLEKSLDEVMNTIHFSLCTKCGYHWEPGKITGI